MTISYSNGTHQFNSRLFKGYQSSVDITSDYFLWTMAKQITWDSVGDFHPIMGILT